MTWTGRPLHRTPKGVTVKEVVSEIDEAIKRATENAAYDAKVWEEMIESLRSARDAAIEKGPESVRQTMRDLCDSEFDFTLETSVTAPVLELWESEDDE